MAVPTRTLLLTALCLGTAVPALVAHDSVEFVVQRQAPFAGPVVIDPSGGGSFAFASSGISLRGWLPLGAFGAQTSGADCWGYTAPSGREYAIMGLSDAVAFVEVTDPGAPQLVEVLPAVKSSWRDIKTYQDHAYYVSEGGDGIQVVDLSQIDAGIVTLTGSAVTPGTTATHNLAVDEASGFLYRTGGGGTPVEGLRIYSLADKDAPSYVGGWNDRYVHDAQVVTYTSGPWAGKQVAFCFSENGSGGGSPGVDILDVTNKGSIQSIGFFAYSTPVFSHQGWLSPDGQYLYLNDELDEQSFGTNTTTRILDVSNLSQPFQAGTFTSGSTSIDHNLYTLGSLIFEANYRSGLRVFDATFPTAPVQTAWFDTYVEDDQAQFNGLWNAYPYLPSGTVLGSDIEKGLFVWSLGDPDLTITLDDALPALIDPQGDALDLTIAAQGGAALEAGSGRLHVDTGGGFTEVPLIALGGGAFRAPFPAAACGVAVRWYLSARTTAGDTWTLPTGAPTVVYGAHVAASVDLVFEEDLESNPGWTVGAPGDDASTGIWERVDPVGTSAQPEDDHSAAPGTMCFVTGQGVPGGGLGDEDVDGGKTTLTTGDIDLSGGDAEISYWRWYSNATGASPNADVFVVEISNDGGSQWSTVETVGPGGDETLGGWFQHAFVVSDLVVPTAQVRLRFVASDLGDGSVVEAAVDDLQVVRYDCTTCQTDLGFGGPGNVVFSICGGSLGPSGSADLSLSQAPPNALAVIFFGLSNSPTPFKGGLLVPVPPLGSLALLTDGSGSIALTVPGSGAPLTAYAQFVVADGSQPAGFSLSNALEIQFGP